MPQNKNQHYVPQSYFRLFSKNGTHIEAYNLKRKQSFTSSIKHMCSKDYFYSKNIEIEKVLSTLESSQDKIMRDIVSDETIPKHPKDYLILLSFICMQHARTETSKLRADESIDLLSDEIVEGLLGSNADVKITYPAVHMLKMKVALQTIPLLGDLIPVIMINKTSKNFIFSDNPIVFHNTFLNTKSFGSLGLQSPGLQIFCPLGDKVMLMLYDPKFYSVNITKNYSLEIHDKNDIEHLNELQFLNCNETIFYSDQSQVTEVKSIHNRVEHLTGKRKMKKENIQISDDEKGRRRELLHFFEERPEYNLELSFVQLNEVSDVGIARNQDLIDRIESDMDKFDKSSESKLYGIVYKIERFFKILKFRMSERFHSKPKT